MAEINPLQQYLDARGESQQAFTDRANALDLGNLGIVPFIHQSLLSRVLTGGGCNAGAMYRILSAVEDEPENLACVTLETLVTWRP